MSFGAPLWCWGLMILPVLGLLYLQSERRSALLLQKFVSPRLLPQLAGNIDRFRRALRFSLILVALALAIIALAKPRWGYTYEDVKRRGLDLLIAVDTSRSMLSNDVAPNRLERVKLAAQDLIGELKGDRAGLIAFAGRAFLQAPLTIDYDAAIESINDLDTKTIPEGGTNISEAISLATRTFGKSAMGNRALIIFTDGEELSGDAVKEAKKAQETGVRIFTIGVGTPQGSLIPIESDNGAAFVKDTQGQVVKSKLDENRLREIATTTGGIYLHLENGPQTMRQLYQNGLAKLQAGEIDARLSRRPIERYEWPLGGAIIALIASLFVNDRKPTRGRSFARTLAPTLATFLVAANVYAVAPGVEAYRQQRYNDALQQFESSLAQHPQNHATDRLQFDAGTAAYKLRDYDKALQAFSQALLSRDAQLQSKGHYNLGNTLYERGEAQKTDEGKLGDWTNALKHYEETMKLEPHNQEAKDNYEFVKKKIEELKKKREQPSPTPPPKQQPNKQNRDQQEQNQQNQQQQQQQNQQQSEQQQQNQQPDSSNQNQQQQSSNNSDRQRDQENSPPSPSPSPSAGRSSQSSKPDEQKKDQSGAAESPTPSPGEGSPSPTPGNEGTSPSPSPGNESGKGGETSPSATASVSPNKPLSGEIKGASEPNQEQKNESATATETEEEKSGQMTARDAERLLQAMKDEEARVQLDERKPTQRVYKDW